MVRLWMPSYVALLNTLTFLMFGFQSLNTWAEMEHSTAVPLWWDSAHRPHPIVAVVLLTLEPPPCQEWNTWPCCASGGPWATDSVLTQRLCFPTVSSCSKISLKIYNIFIAIGKAILTLFLMPAASYPHITSSLVLSQPPVGCITKDLRSEVG